jgi:hypothetical protein
VTVIDIEARQYARMEIGGLFVMFDKGPPPDLPCDLEERKDSRGDGEALKVRISCSGILMEKSSFFFSSMAVDA